MQRVTSLPDTEKVPHAKQLAFYLLTLVASAIPNHWMRCMPPDQTAAAACYADGVVARLSVGPDCAAS